MDNKSKKSIFNENQVKYRKICYPLQPWLTLQGLSYSKTCLKQVSKKPKLFFNTDYRLMQVKSIAECSNGSILQYFQPALSCTFPFIPLFWLFLSGRLRQVLLYIDISSFQIQHVIVRPRVLQYIVLSIFKWPLKTGFTVYRYKQFSNSACHC